MEHALAVGDLVAGDGVGIVGILEAEFCALSEVAVAGRGGAHRGGMHVVPGRRAILGLDARHDEGQRGGEE